MLGSAVTAEFLLGDQWLAGRPPVGQQVGQLVVFVLFYGGGALLVREAARRTGRGWPTILLLAAAFGVLEEGVVDQSLFNPHFAGQDLLSYGFVPALGIGVPWTVFVLTLHVVWSIGAPVAVTEGLFPRPGPSRAPVPPQHQAPCLGRIGLGLAGVGFVVGGAAVFVFTYASGHFLAAPAQLVASVVVAALLVVLGLRLPHRPPRTGGRYVPGVVVGLVATTGFQLVRRASHLSPWLISLLLVAVLVVGAVVGRAAHASAVGLGSGAVLTYAWVGLANAVPHGAPAVIEQVVLVVLAVAVLALAGRRSAVALRRHGGTADAPATP